MGVAAGLLFHRCCRFVKTLQIMSKGHRALKHTAEPYEQSTKSTLRINDFFLVCNPLALVRSHLMALAEAAVHQEAPSLPVYMQLPAHAQCRHPLPKFLVLWTSHFQKRQYVMLGYFCHFDRHAV